MLFECKRCYRGFPLTPPKRKMLVSGLRNITVEPKQDIVCPYCGMVHKQDEAKFAMPL